MYEKPKVKKPKRKILRWVLVIIIGAAIGIFGAQTYKFLRITHTSPFAFLKPPFEGRKFIRVMVLGEDNTHKSSKTGRGLSDTIMVAVIDMETKTVRGISIPRDTRINIEDHGDQKINAAYAIGGDKLAIQAAQAVLGVSVDYYIKTDISGLKEIVDLVGGVGIEVEKDMHYTDRRGGLYINLKKGYRHLDGNKALQYVRFRHDALGDITRIQRQQKFLRALVRQMLSAKNILKLRPTVERIYEKGYVQTDMQVTDLLALAKLARDIPPDTMEMETVPTVSHNINGCSYQEVDREKTAEMVDRLLQSGGHSITAKVAVLNGSGMSGLAKLAADKLEKSGYKVTSTGNAKSFDYENSEIIVHKTVADSAEKIAELIGSADIRKADSTISATDGEDITVIIGKNYRQ